MAHAALTDPRQEILRTAARLFHRKGYDATSMNDVAAALKFSKGGLYHHFQSKDEILFNLMDHAMKITQERVIDPVLQIRDPEQRLRQPRKPIAARAATFALLGMINWIYQWYRPEGALNAEQLARQFTDIFFSGAFQ